MSLIDVESLLQEISPEAPCGADLSYDPQYTEVDGLLTQGMSEGMVADASAAEDQGPNWRDIRTRCVELLGQTKDLRLAVDLTLALLMEDSIPGLRDGLAVVRGFLERFWDHVHPQLDPDDGYDPLERVNIISSLSPAGGTYMDPMMFCQRVRRAPLCKSARMGAFSLRDIEQAPEGGEPTEGESDGSSNAALISAAFEDTSGEDLQAMSQAVAEAVEHLQVIEDGLTDRIGAGQAPQLGTLRDETLGKVNGALQGYLARRGIGGATVAAGEEQQAVGEQPGAPMPAAALSGEIRSTQDVLTALEKICQYYERREPSSPVPMLVRRAQRLVSKSFLEIVRDLSPEAVDQIEKLGGIDSSRPGE